MSLLQHTFRTFQFIVTHPLNQKQKSKGLMQFLKWQLSSRIWKGEIVHHWVSGTKLLLRKGELGLTGNIYTGLHEYSSMSYLLHTLTPSSLFIDIGANMGSYTVLASGVKGARTYCFEPIPETYERLMANLRINNLTERVEALRLGVGEEEGELRFVNDENTTNHVLRENEESSGRVTSVQVKRLDEILKGESPSLIKIDVEGFETPAMRGAQEILRKESLHSIIMEFGSGQEYGYDEKELLHHMLSLGFRTYYYEPMTRQLTDLDGQLDEVDDTNDNTLFVRDLKTVKQLLQTNPPISINGIEF